MEEETKTRREERIGGNTVWLARICQALLEVLQIGVVGRRNTKSYKRIAIDPIPPPQTK